MQELKKVDTFHFYFSLREFYSVSEDARKILKNFTAIPTMGCWKGEIQSGYVLIFIATKEEHYDRVKTFLQVLRDKLGIEHYVRYEGEFYIDKIER